ncbi:PDZ domain-containing protein [Parasulfuritortus cantonensis]|uniref:PDZ domain-containing protein n=1 Tax=Parasulfuritortus cantonensis TaxID=2528202 RepID=A0A4R1B3A4_9PROT|nr:ChaN family lipoprotein [Parasulfuritortus cantonensis]TCJ12331.1 PDZ domain-containing protein [Parasulfuritortus cantonensis]
MNGIRLLSLSLALYASLPALAAPEQPAGPCCRAVNLDALAGLDEIMPVLLDKRVVYLGENHDRYEHHLAQLEVIRRLHRAYPDLAIAMELFPQPVQGALDAYVGGAIDETELLRRSDYFRTSLDYRLYRPILRFAREHGVPVLALNLPDEIAHKVARGGVAALTVTERLWLPAQMEAADDGYRQRIRAAFDQHPAHVRADFENFVTAQVLKDEVMAARAADYLIRNPARRLVILAGNGHLLRGAGIPKRLSRRVGAPSVIVVNNPGDELAPDMADILLFPERQELPPAGRLGIVLSDGPAGLQAGDVDAEGGARAAGILSGDLLLALDGKPLPDSVALRAALLDHKPGDMVRLKVRRPASAFAPEHEQEVAVTLGQPAAAGR